METFIESVKDFDADKLRSLEHVVGHRLDENQQVLIRVTEVGAERDERARNDALARAAELARRGRANAVAAGATEAEADTAIDEALRHVRSQQPSG